MVKKYDKKREICPQIFGEKCIFAAYFMEKSVKLPSKYLEKSV
jgi:hypothetical protein